MLKYSLLALILGFVLDLLIGDPRWLYHPVCVIGNLITVLEKAIRKIFPKSHGGELAGNAINPGSTSTSGSSIFSTAVNSAPFCPSARLFDASVRCTMP